MLRRLRDVVQGKAPAKARRSGKWPAVRKAHLEKFPRCAFCGGENKLEVHHIIPFHAAPDLELEPDNLITLCEAKRYGVNCHLFAGHGGAYKSVNSQVISDVNHFSGRFPNGKKA